MGYLGEGHRHFRLSLERFVGRNFYSLGDYRLSFDRIFREHSMPNEPSFYINAPTRTDPSAAPPGEDSLMVLVPVGHLDDTRGQDWQTLRQRARATVLRRLAAEIGIGDLEDHLKFEISYTPLDWQGLYNLTKGAAFGLSHNFTQVGYLRPRNRHLVTVRDKFLWRNERDPVAHLLGRGLLVEDGQRHDDLRAVMLPYLQRPRVLPMEPWPLLRLLIFTINVILT